MSALIPGSRFIKGKTCIVLDEIQECRGARTALKSFQEDGRFDVIATSSLLGVKGYGKPDESQDSIPVGYETMIEMHPLDFEEFLWANGIDDAVIGSVKSCFENEMAVPDGTQADILKGNLLGYKGAIFENLMADFLCKSGQKLYYFQKESGLELDFLVRYKSECVALEVKARSGKTKSLKTVLKNKSVYHINNAIKLGNYNVGRQENILTIPLYMGFLIKDRLTEVIVPDIDLSLLNQD